MSTKESLINSLQKEVADSSVPLAVCLRKAMILASKIKSVELKTWIESEMNGYDSATNLPNYRIFCGKSYAQVIGYGSAASNVPIPLSLVPSEVRDLYSETKFTQSIGSLEHTATMAEGATLQIPWDPNAIIITGDHLKKTGWLKGELGAVWVMIPTSFVIGLIDSVRNALLKILLGISEEHPNVLESDKNIGQISNERVVRELIIVTGNNNQIAVGSHIRQKTVSKGDKNSFTSSLTDLGICKEDIEKLLKAIEEDDTPKEGTFGEKVAMVLGSILAKAAQGLCEVGVDSMAKILPPLIGGYMGIGS